MIPRNLARLACLLACAALPLLCPAQPAPTAPAAAAPSAPASNAAPVRLRGTVDKLEGNQLSVRTADGQVRQVRLADKFLVVGVARSSIDAIGSGKFIGTTTLGERDGALVALEVHIFPEQMRGTGEGHYDWDLRPASKMTNANVATVTRMGADHILQVQYKGGEQRVLVPASAVVVEFTPSDRSAVVVGAPVFVNAQRQPDGTLTAPRVNVGLNGQLPPM